FYRYLLSFPTRRSSDLGGRCCISLFLFFSAILHTTLLCFSLIYIYPNKILQCLHYSGQQLMMPLFVSCHALLDKSFRHGDFTARSEEHTSELQSRENLV